ncbi:MAG: two-component sensor histidine kinase [Roseibium sp.]|uniref:ATP-binding protein n=1 Tax=Roseibium sp. TaxID=1936156 RepID=UPI002615FF6F|nr:ATP-binding protein [Roseibium sp.]MCV0426677.1 two-component sensor histidine kinase [Roseibium sp.]
MTASPSSFEETSEAQAAASQLTRLGESRWVLISALLIAVLFVIAFQVPVWAAVSGLLVLCGVAAFVPRRTSGRRVQLSTQRERRRMWPGTGMKVTVDALPTPCFVADGRGITRYINASAQEAYEGVKPGDPLSFCLRAPSLLEAFDRVCATGGTERISWIEKVPTETWYEAHIAPMYMPGSGGSQDHGGREPDFILVVIQDQTENRRLERMRTDFVANASHELRTPLASLTGFIETIQGPAKNDPEAQDRFLSIMLDQAGRMRRLIDDILSLSRIELKAHVRPANVVDLSEIIRHTADALSPLAADMNVEIRIEMPASPVRLKGDRDELIQVAENLIENALKYGSNGKFVDVHLSEQNEEPEEHFWILAVRDYGEGIPKEHLPRLTERFYRVDVESSRALKGTGLGLAIVKHILTRHRARLEIDSERGQGTTFTVKLPALENTNGLPEKISA